MRDMVRMPNRKSLGPGGRREAIVITMVSEPLKYSSFVHSTRTAVGSQLSLRLRGSHNWQPIHINLLCASSIVLLYNQRKLNVTAFVNDGDGRSPRYQTVGP